MESNQFTRIVEVNGIKVEIDLRTVKRVDQYKVGDPVKVLVKKYNDNYESKFGMIVGFDEFKERPTIIVAYLEPSTYEEPLKFVYIHSGTKDVEIAPVDFKDLGLEKVDILTHFDRKLATKEQELQDLKRKKVYFEEMFGKYFTPKPNEAVG